jgi:hypothetical protein
MFVCEKASYFGGETNRCKAAARFAENTFQQKQQECIGVQWVPFRGISKTTQTASIYGLQKMCQKHPAATKVETPVKGGQGSTVCLNNVCTPLNDHCSRQNGATYVANSKQ